MRSLVAILTLTAASIPAVTSAQSKEADILNGVGGLIGGILDGAAKIEREKNKNNYYPGGGGYYPPGGGYYPGGGGYYPGGGGFSGSAVKAPNGVYLYPGQSTTVQGIGGNIVYYRSKNSFDKQIYSKVQPFTPPGFNPTPNPGFITPGGGGMSISPSPSDPGVVAPNGQRLFSGQSCKVWDGFRWVTYYRCTNPNCRKLHRKW